MKTLRRYFFLNSDTLLKKGKAGYAIYRLDTGDVLKVDNLDGNILESTESGRTLSEISLILGVSLNRIEAILDNIAYMTMGNYYESRIYIEKTKIGRPYKGPLLEPPIISKCFIEMPGDCIYDCEFCGKPGLFKCFTCQKQHNNNNNIYNGVIKSYIDRTIKIRCSNIIFHGGDPFGNYEYLLDMVEYCRNKGYNNTITIITNGSLIDDNRLQRIANQRVRLVLQMVGNNENIFSEHLRKIQDITKLCSMMNIDTMIEPIIYHNYHYILDAIQNIDRLFNRVKILPAVIYDPHDISEFGKVKGLINSLYRLNSDSYYHNKWHHPCLYGTIALSADGNIRPCPHLDTEVVSRYQSDEDYDAIFDNSRIYQYWDLPLSRIDNCKDCEYSLACRDCRAYEINRSREILGKSTCTFPTQYR